jgi:hypothetical protein
MFFLSRYGVLVTALFLSSDDMSSVDRQYLQRNHALSHRSEATLPLLAYVGVVAGASAGMFAATAAVLIVITVVCVYLVLLSGDTCLCLVSAAALNSLTSLF